MSLDLAAERILHGTWDLSRDSPGRAALQAAGGQAFLQDEGNGMSLPPAGASRAETLFSVVGITLLLLLALSAVWILFNQRR